jgi:hypothetical protein
MGPRLREDDGIKANTFNTVIPAEAGTYNPPPKYEPSALPYNTASPF